MNTSYQKKGAKGTPSILFFSTKVLICIIGFVQCKNFDDLGRKSIVFDLKTPNVFYCPQEKPTDLEKMIVKAKPLENLCEFGGKSKPTGRKSDCYEDIDESGFACDEKRRFMIKLDLLSELSLNKVPDNLNDILAEESSKEKQFGTSKKHQDGFNSQ